MAKNNTVVQDQTNKEEQVTVVDQKTGKEVEPVKAKAPTKSDLIRSMYEEGMAVADIARQTDSHYSFVYGVVKRHLGGESPTRDKGPTKSDQIRELAATGMTPGEIAKELNSNYSFVHTVVKKWKEENDEVAATTEEEK